ncbi:hypothetical protein VNO77_20605 [Canavalia gladiata]|uniref:Leucine-rich repeat-containing N-terminal plant-type domain-containing protein n=1 Tax=Canavalia gladiata TaxID=3824 RepID=A0AAN9QQQ8_CANGL
MKIQTFSCLSITTICCFLCLFHFIFVVSGLCPEDQRFLLLKLKRNLKFKPENSIKLVSWHQSIACCEWSGVTCDKEGHVIGLDLSGDSIYGGLDNSSSLFSFQNLQLLNMANNNFNSEIPSGFSKLKNLTCLNLSYAGFVGHIPIDFSHMTRLVTLDISSLSYSTGQPLKLENLELQKFVQNFTMIRQLYMDGVSITAQGEEWSNALLPLLSLEELSMSNCNLSGLLHSLLAGLKNLSVIRLDQNNLSSTVPETFADFQNLITLNLSSCSLTGIFPEKIFQVATLVDIDISFNNDLYGSLPEFPPNGPLRTLIVSHTRFSGELPASISNLRQLSILDLSNCHFNRTLPSSMSTLTELTHLHLSFNYFTGPIPPLNMSKSLKYIDLSHNHLTGSITSVHLEDLRKLVQIDLQDNFLDGTIPSSIFSLPLLRIIQLSNNKFQGQLHEFSNISFSILEILDLSSNNLEEFIPLSIFHLTSLNVLQLSSNKLKGTLKLDVIQSLANLTALDLSYNNLSIDTTITEASLYSFPMMRRVKLASCNLMEFPGFLRNQSQINTLDLSNNNIQGSIPVWIWQLDSLVHLNLSYNLLSNLEGPMHNTSSTLKVLDIHSNQLQGKLSIIPPHATYLDYSSNNLSSTIPSDVVTYLSSVIFLSLSKNKISGTIPQSLCNKPNLLVLDVSNNYFNGTIPECLTQSKTLVVLNLKHNKLNGKIPDTFLASCALRTLDLNGNSLEGPIPHSMVNCTSLEVLHLGNNHLEDGFPCFLKTLSRLSVMVLRGNKFHGPVGCPHTNGTWHMLQIIDLALNNFSGLLPGKCLKTLDAMMLDEDQNVPKSNHIGNAFDDIIDYQDSVTLTCKGIQMEFFKILPVYTSIDFSSNNFEGPIPEELLNFTGLHVLNLSHNAFTGQISSSIGNLKQLESLDLSSNYFDGEIPKELASLSFLSYLNLSFNHLVGRIPTGTQLQSFEARFFEGNDGLYGSPLSESPSQGDGVHGKILPPHSREHVVDWNIVSAELGLVFGLGVIIGPLLFWKQWRQWYWKHVDFILCRIFPQLNLVYERRGEHSYQVLRWRH